LGTWKNRDERIRRLGQRSSYSGTAEINSRGRKLSWPEKGGTSLSSESEIWGKWGADELFI